MSLDESEIRSLLPWYVNGTAGLPAQTDMAAKLASSPHLQAEARWLSQLRLQLRGTDTALEHGFQADTGLDTLLAMVHAEQAGKLLPFPTRMRKWAASPSRLPAWMGLAAAVILAQAVMLGAVLNSQVPERLAPLSATPGALIGGGSPLLQMTFLPAATELQMRRALAVVHGELVFGPGALGVYMVRVPEGEGAAAVQALQKQRGVVDSVVLLQGK